MFMSLNSIEIVYWHWFIFGGFLLAIELGLGSAYLLWLACAAFLTGIVSFIFPAVSLQLEVMTWAILSIIGVLLWRRYRKASWSTTVETTLNRRGQSLIGHVFDLEYSIKNGRGRARLDGFYWTIKGPNLPSGTKVRITSLDGAEFVVEPYHDETSEN